MDPPLLRDVILELSGVDWYVFGLQLHLPSGVLEDIKRDNDGSVARRSAVVDTWLRTDRSASWEKLITALERVGGHDVLVATLREKNCVIEERNPTPPSPEATCALVASSHPGVVKFTNEMSTKFSSLVHYVFLNFKRRTVALDEIVVYTSTFRVAGKEHTYQLFPKQYVDQLSEATSLVKVFAILGGYWDFQNYHLLEFLVEKLGDHTAKKLVTGYKEEFAVYQRNVKLLEFVAALPECVVKKAEMDSDKMVVKLPQSWPEASLECVEEFHRRFSDAFGIPLHVVRFDTGEEGSIALTWLIPPSLSPVIRTSSLQLASEYPFSELEIFPRFASTSQKSTPKPLSDSLEAQFAHSSLQATTSKAAPLLRDMVIELRGVDPHNLGIQLSLDPGLLDSIERYKAGCEARRSAVVDTWLRTDRAASWEKLITALERVGGHDVLVQRLKARYVTEERNPTPPEATRSLIASKHPGVVKFTKEMFTKFSSLVHDVFLNFKRRKVALDAIVAYTSRGGVHTYQLFSKQYLDQLNKATSLERVFAILGVYWDFQNYHLLEFLVDKLGDYTANKLVRGYTEDFAVFQCNVKLSEFAAALPKCAVRRENMNSVKLILTLNLSWSTTSLECVEEIHRKFSNSCDVPLHVVRFYSAMEGSVVLTWLIPRSVSPIHTSYSSTPLGIPQWCNLPSELATTIRLEL